MTSNELNELINKLKIILQAQDVEVKNCAIESLIDELEDLQYKEAYLESTRETRS